MEDKKFERGIEVIVGVIIKSLNGELFLGKSPKWHGKWVIPGGHIEPGETIEEAGMREGKEETGLDLKSLGIIYYGEMIDSKEFGRPAHFIYFDVLFETENDLAKIDNLEIVEYKWVSPEKALKMDLAIPTKEAVNEYLKFLQKSKNC